MSPKLSGWDDDLDDTMPGGVAVVTVNHNTAELISLLIWSLYRVLEADLTRWWLSTMPPPTDRLTCSRHWRRLAVAT